VRILVYAALLLCAVALAGCGGSDDSSGNGNDEAIWSGAPDPSADGTVAVDGFAEFTAGVEEHWEGSAAMAAAEFLRLDQRTATKTTIEGTAPAEGSGPQTVVVTLDGLLDDSVRAERWTLTFVPDGDVYELTEAQWAQQCQPNRGHQDFSPEPCV
jgi:predicted small secreted protein